MNLYFLNWVKYAWCYNISKPQGLKVSISQVIDLYCQTTKFFMNFLLQLPQKVAILNTHSFGSTWPILKKLVYLESGKEVLQAYQIS